jgi:hypothetical protein
MDVSFECVVFIFRAEEQAKQETSMKQVASRAAVFRLIFYPEDGGDISLRNFD